MIGFIPGIGMQEVLLLGLCAAVPLGSIAVIFVVMKLTGKKSRVRDADGRDEREDIDDRD